MNYDVTVIGEIYHDHVFNGFAEWPGPGEEIFTDAYTWELGGGAVTTACALSKLGRTVQLIGVVGNAQQATIEARLAEFGVSAEHLVTSERRSGITVSISTQQDRTFFTYRGANTELGDRLRGSPDLLTRASRTKHVHLAFPIGADLVSAVLPVLKTNGATVSLDVGHHLDWLRNAESLKVLLETDYLLPNEREADVLCGSADRYLQFCKRLGMRHAVIKLGAAGAAMLSDDVEYRVSAPEVSVVDTTGAGDAFDAGFIEGLLEGASPKRCLELGCACGALSTTAAGALASLPTLEQLQAMSEENDVS